MKFSFNWLKEYTDIKQKPAELAELLTGYSFEAFAGPVLKGDVLLDVDILPNRAHDCLSHYGLSHEISSLTGAIQKDLKVGFKEDKVKKALDFVSVKVNNTVLCPRYMARVLSGVKISLSPDWIQEKLMAFNIKPHNVVVDILNYVMLEMGQPMHAFDVDKLKTRGAKKAEIIVRLARKGEKIKTLDGENHDLDDHILVIADNRNPIAIAGIKGGLDSGIDESTETIVLESANFDPTAVRRGARHLEIMSDAAVRFSQGLDPNLAEYGMDRACFLLQQMAGAKILQGAIDIYPKKFVPRTIKLDLDYVNRLIGHEFSAPAVKKLLELVGLEIKKGPKNSFLVKVPTIRLDLERPEDLIEEIARLYGYEKLKGVMPSGVLVSPEINDLRIVINKMRDNFAAAGFSEAYNYSFNSLRDIENFAIPKEKIWELANPLSDEDRYLRKNLIPNLIKNTAANFRFFDEVKLFEVGKIFERQEDLPFEFWSFAGILGRRNPKENKRGELFYELKGSLDGLFENLGIDDIWYDDAVENKNSDGDYAFWHPGRVAGIMHGEENLGFIEEVSPVILSRLNVSGRLVVFRLDIGKVSELAQSEREFTPLPKYPSVQRDLSILVPEETRVSEILNIIYESGAKLVEDADLFDLFEDERLPESKKSLTFRVIYQADHTLTDAEVNNEENKIKKALVEQLNAEIR